MVTKLSLSDKAARAESLDNSRAIVSFLSKVDHVTLETFLSTC